MAVVMALTMQVGSTMPCYAWQYLVEYIALKYIASLITHVSVTGEPDCTQEARLGHEVAFYTFAVRVEQQCG